ncbi:MULTISPECIES: alanine--tRNA ligase [Shewanella]|jgi:alanyl-tRNA synthetase|uniref:alanine--tRNA ligase n=1 Tax=Shewanella TaxID=22 RepID=UPI000C533005|nr:MULTISPECIES: alanine--tRNA ligase [Shewanella]NCQ45636.1 alanine--tRNA ligase [Shewanella frigidimarina]NCO71773.1 alanine--tRNA ligase [Shewanella vesiculosa]NCP37684.1 alanine--tRNA ligase [Shewanella vesiculosa]NCP69414.1 alanine--tRNA ligase [Shewanella vesiculosa]NCP75305.1 alanine--tRNA ligase [Shewanella vesiculosa]|tara:strand:+ start:262 stop:2886 length:2625 start_codon:yes stop_codon:yes gene_type:complete
MFQTTAELRSAFLKYFEDNGHQVVDSSSLVPTNDPTLLFTNAGMNQFKDVFLGMDKRNYSRATTSQRCVRAGGKHNDLDNVGYTARHHTFFEMLGNFSFGDYFKEDAIRFAWTFLTETLKLPKDRLCVTIYETDDEAYELWTQKIGVAPENMIRIGDNKGGAFASDNFWQMGDTGPCGPCSEIFYDHGDHIWGGRPGTPEEDGDRFIEIWNIVFMQYNRQADGEMLPLPKPSVDTGMGIERIAAIMQGVHSNYEIDIFKQLIAKTAEIIGVSDLENKSLRVIADHIRSCAFLIADGVMPSNEGRGYVLRRIIRRAVRHGNKLGATDAFFYKLVPTLISVMGDAANGLKQTQAIVEKALKAEEEQFARTLERGLVILDGALNTLQGNTLDGETVFKLYDTYGFPVDLTADVCRERDINVDEAGFEVAMAEQRSRAQAAGNFGADYNSQLIIDAETAFSGYTELTGQPNVIGLYVDGKAVDTVVAGQDAVVVLDNTPFYAESGGQVGDKGQLTAEGLLFIVNDTQKFGPAIGHEGQLSQGKLVIGQQLIAQVDKNLRHRTQLNHSVTHLLHAALRQVLGSHVSQKGSLVNPERLRFDFAHFEAVKASELKAVEDLVNTQIRRNHELCTTEMAIDEAKEKGAMALFGEKYDDQVRVVTMGDFSIELCGGTHVGRTGDIGLFKITSEGGIAAGVRRIEAVTGIAAMAYIADQQAVLDEAAQLLKSDSASVVAKLKAQLDKVKQLEKDLSQLKDKLAAAASADMAGDAVDINGVKLLVKQLDGIDPGSLRGLQDELKQKLKSAIIVLGTSKDGKVNLIAGVSNDLTKKVKAGELVAMVAQQVGGKGGGRPDMAQAGGTQPENLAAALALVAPWVNERLS